MARSRRHYRDALTRLLRATGLASVPEASLLVATLKDLAEQLDEGAGQRVTGQWISANKDLQRFLAGRASRSAVKPKPLTAAAKKAAAAEQKPRADPEPNDLQRFKEKRGIAS